MSANLNRVIVRTANGDDLVGEWDSLERLSQLNPNANALREGDLVWSVTHRVVRKTKLYEPKAGDEFQHGPYYYRILHVFEAKAVTDRCIVALRSSQQGFSFGSTTLITLSRAETCIANFIRDKSVEGFEVEEITS